MSKAISISRAVICLTEAALDEEAFGFVRTLLEMALNLRYITNGRSPEVRARRFIQFESKIKMEWRRRGITHFHWSKKERRDRLPSYERFVRLEKKYPRQGWYQTKRNRAWTGTLALEPDRHEKVAVRDEKGNFVLNKSGKTKLVQATWAFDYSLDLLLDVKLCAHGRTGRFQSRRAASCPLPRLPGWLCKDGIQY